MARQFKNFNEIPSGDFVPFTEGYHILTITGHTEGLSKKGDDTDIFEVMNVEGATCKFTLYYVEKAFWTYKKLIKCCGADVDKMQGDQNINLDKLIGKTFGALVEVEEVENPLTGEVKKYPRVNMTKVYTVEKAKELMATYIPKVKEENNDMTPVNDDGDLPF